MVGFAHQESQRHFENICNLGRIGRQLEAGAHERDGRRNDEAGSCAVGFEIAERLNECRIKSDLFTRFAKRRSERVGIVLFDFAARKGDLPGMRGQVFRPLGQNHAEDRTGNDRHQHGGGFEIGGKLGGATIEVIVARRMWRVESRGNLKEARAGQSLELGRVKGRCRHIGGGKRAHFEIITEVAAPHDWVAECS